MKGFLVFFLLGYISSADSTSCDEGEISCANGDGCVRQYYICDADDDCWDDSDEDHDLCYAWKNDECSRSETLCTRYGETSCVPITNYCMMNDPPCEGDLDRRICQMLEGGILSELRNFIPNTQRTSNLNASELIAERFQQLVPRTLSHEDCPSMFTQVGDQCLSIFYVGKMGWAESREFCNLIGGELAIFPDVTYYAKVLQHLQQIGMTSDFWIGGVMEDENQGWTWTDGSSMQSGSPFWAIRYSSVCVDRNVTSSVSEQVCYEYEQAPKNGANGQCVSLSFENFFYMTDSDCLEKKSPICIYNGQKLD